MNDYYVYIYWRLDTNEPFYVGKGRCYRWQDLSEKRRNKHFIRIIEKHPIAVEIVKDELTNEQASDIECWLINELVFEFGFSIDIKDNYSTEQGFHLVNQTWGGEGCSGRKLSKTSREKLRQANLGKHHSEETRQKQRMAKLGKYKGKNNPSYGRKHTIETKQKMSENHADVSGKNNPIATSVICITTKRIFYTTREGAKYYKCNQGNISACCRGKRNYCGKYKNQKLVWKYLVWKHSKKYRIKSIK